MNSDTTLAELKKYPYAVLYNNQWQRQLPSQEVLSYLQTLEPEYAVRLNGIEYARVYHLRKEKTISGKNAH